MIKAGLMWFRAGVVVNVLHRTIVVVSGNALCVSCPEKGWSLVVGSVTVVCVFSV